MSVAEVGRGEGLDGAGEVAEGDAPVDHQPLDLVEHGQVAGVGRVEPEAPPRHDGVDGQGARRHRLLHQVDLHRRGVGAQQHRLGLAEVEVHGVVHAAGRVGRRDVQRLEVVPVGLGLGTLGDAEAHADEDVLELVPGLGHQVEVARVRGAVRTWSGMTSVRSRRSAAQRARPARLAPATVAAVGQLGLEARARASCEAPTGLLARLGLEARPASGGPWSARSACPRNSVSTCASASRRRRAPRWPARRRRRGRSIVEIHVVSASCRSLAANAADATPAPAPPPRRWRNASKHTTAQATPTLSDSARPAMGMAT